MPRFALCQVTSSEQADENIELIRERTRTAAQRGARVVVFPEAMMTRFGTPLAPVAEPLDGAWAQAVAAIAAEHDVMIVAGMFTPAPDGRVYNTALITGGDTHTGYNKIHLYDAFGFHESDTVAGGFKIMTVDVDDIVVGIATCYDLRFPELFQALADAGSSAVIVPASWGAGEGKREQWELLVRARALDSGSWILACDQAAPAATGTEVNPKAPTGIGYTMAADPWGRRHASLDEAPELLLVDVDPELADDSRTSTGTLLNRRLGG